MKKKLDWFLLLLVIAFSIFAARSIFTPGLFTSHDSESHIARMIEFNAALSDKQFPPQWGSGFFGGIGSPVMMLNYQLPYFLGEVFVKIGFSFFNAYKLVLVTTYIASGIFAYFCFKRFGSSISAFLGALIYLWSPYRLVDLYVRGSLGESFSFMFPPLILIGIHTRSFWLVTLGFAGLFLSHPVASAIYLIFFSVYFVIRFLPDKPSIERNKKLATSYLVSLLLAVGISAFNILPTIFLTKFTQYTPNDTHPLNHFPTVVQLLAGKWGYGFSTEDVYDLMSFRIGYANLIVFSLVLVVLFRKFLASKKTKDFLIENKIVLYYLLFVVGAFFMMIKSSSFVWKLIQLDNFVDYPWRFLLLMVFLMAFLSNWFIASLKNKKLAIFLVIVIAAINVRSNINHIKINSVWPWGIEHYMTTRGTGDALGEYSSIWRRTRSVPIIKERAEIIGEDGQLQIIESRSNKLIVETVATQSAELYLNIMYFPGWKLSIDGHEQMLNGEVCIVTKDKPQRFADDRSGLIACQLSKGKHLIEATYVSTTVQKIGNVVSLLSIAAFIWILSQSLFPHLMSPKALKNSLAQFRKRFKKQKRSLKS